MIRPQGARWFEVLSARDDAFVALEALAKAGCVEIEGPPATAPAPSSATAAALRSYASLLSRYGPYWPSAAARPTAVGPERLAPAEALAAAVERLERWAAQAEPLIARLQEAETRAAELALTEQVLTELRSSRLDLAQLARARHGVIAQVFAVSPEAPIAVPGDCLVRETRLQRERLVLALGPPQAIEALAKAVLDAGGRRAQLPSWVASTPEQNLDEAIALHATLAAQAADLRAGLASLARQYDLAHARGEVVRAAWCFEHGGDVGMGDAAHGDVFARITGWTIDAPRLTAALEASDARALVRFPVPPRDAVPPLVLRNPWWARPFELFTGLIGMPAATAADPSVLLAGMVPLMFGYMFGDVGQGLVLAAAGAVLGRRTPALRMLIAGGAAASAFGVLFGTVFCSEAVLRPVWMSPLARPLQVLEIPVLCGAALLLLGMLVNLLESVWQGALDHWMRVELPLMAAYAGVLAMPLSRGAWLLVAAALAAGAAGGFFDAVPGRSRAGAALTALARTAGDTIEVLINTLSFARVGAFALAHAGLASAVTALAATSSHATVRGLVFVAGNVVILLLEGLVVSIQTTRLVLFEFFIRFFEARGRPFRALAPPTITIEES